MPPVAPTQLQSQRHWKQYIPNTFKSLYPNKKIWSDQWTSAGSRILCYSALENENKREQVRCSPVMWHVPQPPFREAEAQLVSSLRMAEMDWTSPQSSLVWGQKAVPSWSSPWQAAASWAHQLLTLFKGLQWSASAQEPTTCSPCNRKHLLPWMTIKRRLLKKLTLQQDP